MDEQLKAQAHALLVKYYEQERARARAKDEKCSLPEKPCVIACRQAEDGTLIVVDGASGRKLHFEPKPETAPKPKGSKPEPAPKPKGKTK